ncbi:hypothetical protein GCM10009792_16100 [Microcella alkalica]|uniref:Uncharacterized protein n=1 Tax=Microcella alkalica TaxID=355930 RepID=A0A839E3I6_9MICO|nr:hypothetical protein [Microcella alkalica]
MYAAHALRDDVERPQRNRLGIVGDREERGHSVRLDGDAAHALPELLENSQHEARDLLGAVHGPTSRAHDAAAVADRHGVGHEQGLERGEVATLRRRHERSEEVLALLARDRPASVSAERAAPARDELPRRGLGRAENVGEARAVVGERLAQHHSGALGAAQPLEKEQGRKVERLGAFRAERGVVARVDRLGQPRAHVSFTAHASGVEGGARRVTIVVR